MTPVYKWASLQVYRRLVWLDYFHRIQGATVPVALPVLERHRSELIES